MASSQALGLLKVINQVGGNVVSPGQIANTLGFRQDQNGIEGTVASLLFELIGEGLIDPTPVSGFSITSSGRGLCQ